MKYLSTGSNRTGRSNPSTTESPQRRRTPRPLGQRGKLIAFLGLLAGTFSTDIALAQGPLTNGWTHTGVIAVGGEVDSWTFEASAGDNIAIRVGEISQTNSFTPRIRIMNPLDVQQVAGTGPVVVGVATVATNTGTFTVLIDGVAANATAPYRMTLVKAPGAVSVAPGDEGGPLTNGVTHTGSIDVGDTDVWTVSANAGDNLTLRIGETTAGSALTPALWILGPNGAQLDFYGSSAVAGEVSVRATNTGTFIVMVADNNGGANYAGTGGYRLTLARTGSPIVVSPGDEGGTLVNGQTYPGTIDLGDIDVWSFTANAGDSIFVAMGEAVAGSALTPALWLYGPNGVLITSYGSSAVAAEISARATNSGTFTLVAGDFSSVYSGSGGYQLTMVKTGDPITVSPGDHGGPLTNGVTHTGGIYVGDVDIWNFSASAGESITVRMGELVSGSALHPALFLYGPNGALLDSYVASAVAGEVGFRATNSGTFTLVAGDWSNAFAGSGGYRLTLAKTGSPIVTSAGDEGGTLVNGQTYTGTIDLGDIDVWSFTASAGDSIFVAMGEAVAGSALTPAVWLYGPNGVSIISYGASSVAAEINTRATNGGTFTVVVGDYASGYSGSGGYQLTMVKTGDPIIVSPGDHGGPMTNGVTHTGDIYVGDVDIWNFSASAGESITVRMGELASGSSLTPALFLFGPNGALLDSYVASSIAGEVYFRATNSGIFTLVAGDWSNAYAGSGGYRLTLAKTGSPIVTSPGDEGGPLVNGQTYPGTIDSGDIDVWSFTASAGDSIFVAMGEAVAGSALTPALWLYGPNGVFIASYGASTVAAEISTRATNSGTFTVVAGDYSNVYGGTGAYRLTMVKSGDPIVVSPGDQGGPMTNGFTHAGDIYIGDLDIWNFTANAGENITLRMGELAAGSLTPVIWLIGPNGVLLDSYGASGVAAEVSVRATNSGAFTVIVGDYSNAYGGSGAYRLTLGKTGSPIVVSSGDEGGILVNGLMHTGVIDMGDIDVWSFDANAGDALVVRMGDAASGGSALTPALWLYGPDGRLLASYGASSLAAEVSFRATNSGTFMVIAGDFSNAYGGSGPYRLTLARTGAAVEVSPADQGGPLNGSDLYEGALESGDLDVFYFTLCRGDDILVRLEELNTGSSLTPWIRLYGRDGALIRSVSGAASAQVSLLATNSGTFVLVLGDFSNAYSGSGDYHLTVNGLSAGLKMCVPGITGTNAALSGVGGVSGEEFVVLTSPLVEAPLATWTPLFTNLFDFYGAFNRTSRFLNTEPRRFYIIRQGGGVGPN